MKYLVILLCLLLSPLSFASYHNESGSSGGSSGGGYGGGSSGGALALVAVGALVYYMNRDTDDEDIESTFIQGYKKSKFNVSLGSRKDFNNLSNNFSNNLNLPSNNFQLNLTYKLN